MLKNLCVMCFSFISVLANAGISYTVSFQNNSNQTIVSTVTSPHCIYNAGDFNFTLAPGASRNVNLKTKNSGFDCFAARSSLTLQFNNGSAEASISAYHATGSKHAVYFQYGSPYPTYRVTGTYISDTEIKITFLPTF